MWKVFMSLHKVSVRIFYFLAGNLLDVLQNVWFLENMSVIGKSDEETRLTKVT